MVEVWTFGCNDEFPLGRECPEGLTEDPTPGLVEFPEGTAKIIDVVAGDTFTASLTADGSVYAWGGFRVRKETKRGIM